MIQLSKPLIIAGALLASAVAAPVLANPVSFGTDAAVIVDGSAKSEINKIAHTQEHIDEVKEARERRKAERERRRKERAQRRNQGVFRGGGSF